MREEYLRLKSSTFLTDIANGLSESEARILARPNGRPLSAPSTSPQVPGVADDPLLVPDQEGGSPHPAGRRTSHGRACGADISYFDCGHLGLISDPVSVTRVIERAAEGDRVAAANPTDQAVDRELRGTESSMSKHSSSPQSRKRIMI